jgi:hypothetical protein
MAKDIANKVASDVIENIKIDILAHVSTNPWDIRHPHVPLLNDVITILKDKPIAEQKEIVLKINAISESAIATSKVFDKAYSTINSKEML